jgi:hypothetical protein
VELLAASAAPQSPQNLLPAGLCAPHCEQREVSGAPQSPQNFLPPEFSAPQVEHSIVRLYWPPTLKERGDPRSDPLRGPADFSADWLLSAGPDLIVSETKADSIGLKSNTVTFASRKKMDRTGLGFQTNAKEHVLLETMGV